MMKLRLLILTWDPKLGALPKFEANLSSEPQIHSCDDLAKTRRSGKGHESIRERGYNIM
jgi:hypothetical protein